jgi:hypothetical protein
MKTERNKAIHKKTTVTYGMAHIRRQRIVRGVLQNGTGKGARVMTARKLALAAIVFVGLIGPSMANDLPLRGNILYRLHVPVWPAVQPSWKLAPWYMWWPADANQTLTQHDFQSSPYPGWHASAHAAAPAVPQGQMTYAPAQPNDPAPFYPVNYPRHEVPSYWYGR